MGQTNQYYLVNPEALRKNLDRLRQKWGSQNLDTVDTCLIDGLDEPECVFVETSPTLELDWAEFQVSSIIHRLLCATWDLQYSHEAARSANALFTFLSAFIQIQPHIRWNEYGHYYSTLISPETASVFVRRFRFINFECLERVFTENCRCDPDGDPYETIKSCSDLQEFAAEIYKYLSEAEGQNMALYVYRAC